MYKTPQKENFTQTMKKEDWYPKDDYSLQACMIKLEALIEKYPEIQRAKEISIYVCKIRTDPDIKVRKKKLEELEKMLNSKVEADRERLERVMSKEEREFSQYLRIKR